MFTIPLTPTEFASRVLSTLVGLQVAKVTKEQLERHTDLNPDGLTVKGTASIAGFVASEASAPVTDKIVNKTVSTFKSWREKKQDKKNAKSE